MIKLIVLGDSNVGKTNTIHRYINNKNPNIVTSTIGVEFFVKQFKHNGNIYPVYIWDTAGQERFKSIISTYFRNQDCAIVFFDLTKYRSFLNLENWLIELRERSDKKSCVFIIGNKTDLVNKNNEIVSYSQMDTLLEKYPEIIDFKFVSGLTGENVHEAIDDIIKITIEKTPNIESRIKYIEINEKKNKKRKCGCN